VKAGKLYIGTSGYSYNHWSGGVFYPSNLKQDKWLEYYCKHFNTVELNVTFYRLPQKQVFAGWNKRTPENFVFAIKGSRFITHIKRLRAAAEPLKLMFKRAEPLSKKIDVVLWQLPPKFKCDIKRLSDFLKNLQKYKNVRHVFEFRDASWFNKDIYKLLKKSNIAICSADWPECSNDIHETCDFIYIRRHGASARLYSGCYSGAQLKKDANLIKKHLSKGKDVYIYFNNDTHGYAVKNAKDLKKII